MSSTDDAVGETFVWRGRTFVIADAQHDESDMGEHWHLTVVPRPSDGRCPSTDRKARCWYFAGHPGELHRDMESDISWFDAADTAD